jgi:L-histidine N-alpha-methyltransferase
VASDDVDPVLQMARDVARGLTDTPPWLSSKYLYDEEGSRLFEAICEQPEYYLTRTEGTILSKHASQIAGETGPVTLIELGSGSAAKTDHLLSAYAAGGDDVLYVPVDVSETALEAARDDIVERHRSVTVAGIAGTYESAFPLFKRFSPAMVLFLGSSIGNFDQRDADGFWGAVSSALPSGDYFLLGVDLIKSTTLLHAAYNDAAGVTAAFTKNLFARLNKELGAGVELDQIEHVARYNAEWQRVEIFARFLTDQQVHLEPLDRTVDVEAGTMMMTEISRKFSLHRLKEYLASFDFSVRSVYTDDNEWFAVLLLQRESD